MDWAEASSLSQFMEELMKRIPARFAVLTVCLLILNTAGLLWIRHEFIQQSDPESGPVRVVQTLSLIHI